MFTQTYFFELAGAKMTLRLRSMTFKALMRQEVGFFDEDGHSLGALTSRLAVDAASVGEMVTKVWGDVAQLTATLVAGLVIAFVNTWLLTFIILACTPFTAAAKAYETKIFRGFEDATKKAYEESGEVAAEAIKEIRTVASLTIEKHFEDKFAASIEKPHQLARRKAFLSSVGYGATQGLNMYTNAVGFYAGVRLIAAGQTDFTHMFVTIMAVIVTGQGIGRSSTFTSKFAKAKYAAINTFELLDRMSLIDPDAPGEVQDKFEGDFDFKVESLISKEAPIKRLPLSVHQDVESPPPLECYNVGTMPTMVWSMWTAKTSRTISSKKACASIWLWSGKSRCSLI
jgi:ABC-type multidrug transport system fused ATPase/permease subunit